MIRKIFVVGSLLLVSGCSGTPHIALAPTVAPAPHNELPPPAALGTGGNYIYALGPLDTVSIEVDGMPDLRRDQVMVDGQGMIAYPMAGSVTAAGLTTTQLASRLEQRMRENHVRDPKVSVNLVTEASHLVTIGGEVNKPGVYPISRRMSLTQAVALAGGETGYARSSVVLVFRDVGSQRYVGLYNVKAISYGDYPDPQIYPNDQVVVGEDQARRLLQMVGPFVGLVTTPLIYLINRGGK